jgi:hypothetical protein
VVFTEGDVSHIVGTIFYRPMAAVERKQALGAGRIGGQVGDGVDGFGTGVAGFEVGDFPLDAADLGEVGKVEILVEEGGGGKAPDFQAPVALIDGFGAEGKNAPGAGPRWPRRGPSGSP